ncbi:MAG: hypothetical protein NZ898_13650 [Myxococcota bacterium]|nr:hypothetical protein [Myxococcota bacterium]MDW8361068.1 hypothetical protein [Myxococcales bacterium]
MPRPVRRLLRDERGNATAEAVIMIPFFILVWTCVLYAADGWGTAVRQAAETRRDAWAHVLPGCEGRAPEGLELSDATNPPFAILGDAILAIDRVLRDLPILGDYYPGLFVEEREMIRRATVEKPAALGGDDAEARHRLVLACNEVPRPDFGLAELAERVFGFLW